MTTLPLFYNTYGAHPTSLVILHGFLGASGNWHTLARTVFANHFRVLTPDARNHGRSPHAEAFSYGAMATDVLRLLDAQELEHAVLLGHSMGGKTAMRFALDYPDRTQALVVVDIAPRAYPPQHDTILEALNSVDLTRFTSRQEIDAALETRVPDWGVRQFLLKNLTATSDGGYRWLPNLPVLTRQYEEVTRAVEASAAYAGPVLFVRGGRSPYVQDADVPDLYRLFPTAQLVTIPGAGHWVHAEAPQPLAEAVLSFLLPLTTPGV